MALRLVSLEDKIKALDTEIVEARRVDRPPGSAAQHHYEALKSLAADVRARMDFPRSNALGELERAIARMIKSKTVPLGYDRNMMSEVANVLVNKWPAVSQALEMFGEQSCE